RPAPRRAPRRRPGLEQAHPPRARRGARGRGLTRRLRCRMRRVDGDGVQLAVLDEGEGDATALLLHGFPDSARLWRHQVPRRTQAARGVAPPDLRGFGESGKPADVGEYRITRSVADMVALLDELGIERARVVGHDWGAGVAWVLAALVPDRVE